MSQTIPPSSPPLPEPEELDQYLAPPGGPGAAWCHFDAEWYLQAYPEARAELLGTGFAAVRAHYLTAGRPAGLSPNMLFDEAWYLQRYPEVAAEVAAGLVASGYEHYCVIGFLTHDPHWLFDGAFYAAGSADVTEAALAEAGCYNPYDHYLKRGAAEGRLAHRLFDPATYRAGLDGPERPAPDQPAFQHFLRRAWFERRDAVTSASFDPAWFRAAHPLLAGEIDAGRYACALHAYLSQPPEARLAPLPTPAPTRAPQPAPPSAGRPLFAGANTLANLTQRVFLELEEVILCPPDGLTLIGWTLSAPGTLAAIRLYSGTRCTPLELDRCIRYDRPDVRETVGAKHGLGADPRAGFMAHLPASYDPAGPSYLEIETAAGEIGHRPLNPPRMRGMEAIRFLTDRVNIRYDEVVPALDHVLGPSIASLNADRLLSRPHVREIRFGTPPAAPALSVIVCLYGRIDFIEYQLGLLSRHTPAIAIEYLYVLDDPSLVWQAETLCASLFARFRIPLRLLVLDRNMGYAPANNIGLAAATAPHVCFMNSDVFPDTPDWAEHLLARLEADPALGAIGPLLLFEDGSVQHQGMHFERIPVMGDLHFPLHDRKGWKPPSATGLRRVPAATAACLLMSTSLARDLGGIDEAYLIGDFEDADLCLKLRVRGLACAVDLDTRMYHLERQSQAGPENRWRLNVTLFNAWVHERRWAETLAALDAEAAS